MVKMASWNIFNFGQVLRFFALLDGINSENCEIRAVIIRYYLADGTVDIREILKPNSGRYNIPFLLRRQRIPKKIKPGTRCTCIDLLQM